VITGGNYHRLHEELTLSGGELKSNGFSRITTLGRLESLIEDASTPSAAVISAAQKILSPLYSKAQDSILAAIDARSKDRLKFLENSLARRKQADIDDITTVLTDLEKAISREIEDSKAVQLELWQPDERQQLRRDLDALHARLKRIPEERSHEAAAIEQRYANYEHRTFPVAVIFIVPPNFGKGGNL
jgi:hypothetical protein